MNPKRQTNVFEFNSVMAQAWDLQWKGALERAEKWGEKNRYVTATDMVNQIKQFAAEVGEGKKMGSTGSAWGGTYSWHRAKVQSARYGLLQACRTWLLAQTNADKLEAFNFDRGHVSGMRFRVPGAGLSAAEKKTIAARENRKPYTERIVHHSKPNGYRVLCVAVKKAEAGQDRWYSSRHRGSPRTTDKLAEVTCKACLNLLKGRACFSYKRDDPYEADGNTQKKSKDIYVRVVRYATVDALLAGKPCTEVSKHHDWKDAKAALAAAKKGGSK